MFFLFIAVINDLIEQGRLNGTIQGRQDKANFVPEVYSRTQNDWVDASYQQNGYLGRSLIEYAMCCNPVLFGSHFTGPSLSLRV